MVAEEIVCERYLGHTLSGFFFLIPSLLTAQKRKRAVEERRNEKEEARTLSREEPPTVFLFQIWWLLGPRVRSSSNSGLSSPSFSIFLRPAIGK